MAQTRFQIARPDIVRHFDAWQRNIFTPKEIGKILEDNREHWRLSMSMPLEKFIDNLIKYTPLSRISLKFPNGKEITRYNWRKNASAYEVALSLRAKSYLSHYTAVYINGLTEQIPKSIYSNAEQSPHPQKEKVLTQEDIDIAFRGEARITKNVTKYQNRNIYLLTGKHTDQLGVIEIPFESSKNLKITNIERTLIDCAVRPSYSGGIYEVLHAFQAAKEKVSINKLSAYLKKLNFRYPYHQAIGFYLEMAGYKESSLRLMEKQGMQLKFYLTHAMAEMEYCERWRLYFPKGMKQLLT